MTVEVTRVALYALETGDATTPPTDALRVMRAAVYALETEFVPPPPSDALRVMRAAVYALETVPIVTGLFAYHNGQWQDVQPFVKLADARVVETGDTRVTEAGVTRVLEAADGDWFIPSATYIRHGDRWRRVLPPLFKGQTDG